MSRKSTRRGFIKSSALAGVGYWAGGGVAAAESRSPSERIRFACIGVGGRGGNDSSSVDKLGDVVAICDVDKKALAKKAREFPKAKRYFDFRKMLDQMHRGIDAVTISTPDHTHAPATAMAMRLSVHCFCQKPLAHCVYEARRLAQIAREMNVVTQMGNQGTVHAGLKRNVRLIRAGAVGTVKEIHAWTHRPIWPQGIPRPKPAPVPGHLKWDLWLAAAPSRPYAAGYHPFMWRGWWDFGTGGLGNMGCHILNMPFLALDLRDPKSVEAETPGHNRDSFPRWSVVRYEFAATSTRPALSLVWYDGGKLPPRELFSGRKIDKHGSLIIGDSGTLYSPASQGTKTVLLHGAEDKKVESKSKLKKSDDIHEDWVRAIRAGRQAAAGFPDRTGPLTEIVLVGNLAVWCGKKVEWDAANLKVKGMPELDPIIRRRYRAGYEL